MYIFLKYPYSPLKSSHYLLRLHHAFIAHKSSFEVNSAGALAAVGAIFFFGDSLFRSKRNACWTHIFRRRFFNPMILHNTHLLRPIQIHYPLIIFKSRYKNNCFTMFDVKVSYHLVFKIKVTLVRLKITLNLRIQV